MTHFSIDEIIHGRIFIGPMGFDCRKGTIGQRKIMPFAVLFFALRSTSCQCCHSSLPFLLSFHECLDFIFTFFVAYSPSFHPFPVHRSEIPASCLTLVLFRSWHLEVSRHHSFSWFAILKFHPHYIKQR